MKIAMLPPRVPRPDARGESCFWCLWKLYYVFLFGSPVANNNTNSINNKIQMSVQSLCFLSALRFL